MTSRLTAPLITLLLAAVAPVRAQFIEDCPRSTPAIEDLLGSPRMICTGQTQGLVHDPNSAGTLLVDEHHRFRGFIATLGERAVVYQGSIANDGSVDDTIFWGTWTRGTLTEFEEGRVTRNPTRGATPFVAGVEPGFFFRKDVLRGAVRSHIPTTGTFDYRMLGRPVIVSSGNAVHFQSDRDGQPIDPGPIESATVRVDFERHTGTADITFAVRGIRTRLEIPLARRNINGRFTERHDDDTPSDLSPTAEVRFYGRQGEFMGLEIRVPYQSVSTHEAFARASMPDARGHAIVALRRGDGS